MSLIVLQVGQAGNQLGQEFFSQAAQYSHSLSKKNDYFNNTVKTRNDNSSKLPLSVSPYFHKDNYAHSICIDSEPKVVQQLINTQLSTILNITSKNDSAARNSRSSNQTSSSKSNFKPVSKSLSNAIFRRSNILFDQYGRGNNWALGYNGRKGLKENLTRNISNDNYSFNSELTSSQSLSQQTLECLRIECEKCDQLNGVIMMHSSSGGTGSGLGSRIISEITNSVNDEYSDIYKLTATITPFAVGDTPLQHFNNLLCLSNVYQNVDGMILFSNEDIKRTIENSIYKINLGQSIRQMETNFGFELINRYISSCLLDLLSPLKESSYYQENFNHNPLIDVNNPAHALAGVQLSHLITSTCPLSSHKLLECWTTSGLVANSSIKSNQSFNPFAASWSDEIETLIRIIPREASHIENEFTDSRTLTSTLYLRGPQTIPNEQINRLTDKLTLALPPVQWNSFPIKIYESELCPQTSTIQSLSICMNRTRHCNYLESVLLSAKRQFNVGAYLHWFQRYDCHETDIKQAFERIQTIIDDYSEIVRD